MTPDDTTITGRRQLDEQELRDVEALRAECEAHEGLILKLVLPTEPSDQDKAFLAHQGERLTGYCSLDSGGGGEVELCGMVHPEQRRRGIGRALLAAAIAECRRRGADKALVICEDASQAGRRFVAAAGGQRTFSEYHMRLGRTGEQRRPPDEQLDIRQAGPADLDDLVYATARAWGDREEDIRPWIGERLGEGNPRFFLARRDGAPIGSMRIHEYGGSAGIYGFVMLPEARGRGYGRQFLTAVLAQLRGEPHQRITLEVETENAPAVGLYRSLGFEEATTYGYYELALS